MISPGYMRPTLTLNPSPSRGFMTLGGPNNESVNRQLRAWPGTLCRYSRGHYQWVVPSEFAVDLTKLCTVAGLQVDNRLRVDDSSLIGPEPYSWIPNAAKRAVHEGSYMFNFEMGLGKTHSAILALQEAGCQRILVICPAIARDVWKGELAKWWPACTGVGYLTPGLKSLDSQLPLPIVVTSYELLKKVPLDSSWDAIVCDESHYIAHGGPGGANRTRLVQQFRQTCPRAMRLALTATPVMTDPKQLHAQWEFLYPGRLGSWTKFTRRYCQLTATGWVSASGKEAVHVFGINDDYAPELRMRLSAGMARVTKQEVAHLLPPLLVQTIRVDRPRGFDASRLVERFLHAAHPDPEEFVGLHSANKIASTARLALDALSSTAHVMVLTYLHRTAHQIAAAIQAAGTLAVAVTGEQTPPKRKAALQSLLDSKQGVAVVSMASIKEAIDLTAFTTVYFAELYPSPGLMEQVCGRFHRLNSTLPVSIYFVIVSGSYEERVAASLEGRIKAQGKAYRPSLTAGAVEDAFKDKRSDEDFAAHLNDLLANVSLEREEL